MRGLTDALDELGYVTSGQSYRDKLDALRETRKLPNPSADRLKAQIERDKILDAHYEQYGIELNLENL